MTRVIGRRKIRRYSAASLDRESGCDGVALRDPAGLSVSGAGVNIPNSRQVAGETPNRMRQALTAFLHYLLVTMN